MYSEGCEAQPGAVMEIDEQEVSDVMSVEELARIQRGQGEVLVLGGADGHENLRIIMDALPRAVAKRLKKMSPPDFHVIQFAIAFELKGTPFGVGVGGKVEVVFGPRK
jgi:hypothetical protein